MARRTKAEAQATRSLILDTAELIFDRHGVSGTSLHDIAQAAGLTRGAIYWHFKDKADVFNAMMARATLPLEEAGGVCGFERADITLSQMRDGFVEVLRRVTTDPQLQRVFGVATLKVEYVAEMNAVRERHLAVRDACVDDVERTLRAARRRGELNRRLPARTAAIGLHALFDGLLRNWMLTPGGGFDLVRTGAQLIDAYLDSLRAPAPARAPARARKAARQGAGRP